MKSGYRFYHLCSWVSRGLGRAGLGGHSPHQLPHLLLGLVGDLHPVPERGTVEMVLIQCLDPS